jgi:hypothetical protein
MTCAGPGGTETVLLVRSADRRAKEQAIHARFSERLEAGLTRLAGRLARARQPVDRGPVERQLGRLLARTSRAAGRYAIALAAEPTVPAGLRLTWTVRPEWDAWAACSEGCYVLRTNIPD